MLKNSFLAGKNFKRGKRSTKVKRKGVGRPQRWYKRGSEKKV